MMVYINYPNPRFRIHCDPDCPFVKRRKDGRLLKVTVESLKEVLLKFINHEIIFRANPPNNDLWLDISLSTPSMSSTPSPAVARSIIIPTRCRL